MAKSWQLPPLMPKYHSGMYKMQHRQDLWRDDMILATLAERLTKYQQRKLHSASKCDNHVFRHYMGKMIIIYVIEILCLW